MQSIITIIAKYFILVPVALAVFVWLKLSRRKKFEFILLGFFSAVVALLLAKLGSHVFYNPRPFAVGHFTPYFAHAADNGFPSDHTLFGSLIAWVTWKYDRRIGYISLAAALLVGVARVVAGVHHLADIVGAFVIAGIAVAIVNGIFIWWIGRRKVAA